MATFATPIDKPGAFKVFDELASFSRHVDMVLKWYHNVKVCKAGVFERPGATKPAGYSPPAVLLFLRVKLHSISKSPDFSPCIHGIFLPSP